MLKFNYLIVVIFISFKTSLCQNYGLPSGDVCLDFKKNLNSEFAKDCFQNLDECQQVMQLLQKGIRCVPACGERERCVMVHGRLQCNCTSGYEGKNCLIINVTTNCNDNNATTSGVYFLRENLQLKPVYCQVETVGGNWLVFQQRIDGSVDFYRNWTEYQRGFGDVEGNYWLGLDAIHAITSSGSYQLRVDLEDWKNNTFYALYRSFSVGNESSNYRLSLSGYSGTADVELGGMELGRLEMRMEIALLPI